MLEVNYMRLVITSLGASASFAVDYLRVELGSACHDDLGQTHDNHRVCLDSCLTSYSTRYVC